MTDLTAITTPFGILLEQQPEVAAALKAHGGPYEIWYGKWTKADDPSWDRTYTYRVKPAPPKPREWWIELNPSGSVCRVSGTKPEAPTYSSGKIVHVREVLETDTSEWDAALEAAAKHLRQRGYFEACGIVLELRKGVI